jgi:hypothetical protein
VDDYRVRFYVILQRVHAFIVSAEDVTGSAAGVSAIPRSLYCSMIGTKLEV